MAARTMPQMLGAVLKLTERGYHFLCLALGRLLRSARYATARIVQEGAEARVRKQRSPYAPLLIAMGGPLMRLLDTGVRVLPQREWEARERRVYETLHGAPIRVDPDGTLVLPCLTGRTLANLLDDPTLEVSESVRAIELAAVALAAFHAHGFTHGDAMADNVLVDLEAGVAHWIDFETVHDAGRTIAWRRADDVRALLATCVLRADSGSLARTLELILDAYAADEAIARLLATSFASVMRRPLAFHLGQAGLSLRRFQEIGVLLRKRSGE